MFWQLKDVEEERGTCQAKKWQKISDVERNEDRGRGKKWSIYKRKRPA